MSSGFSLAKAIIFFVVIRVMCESEDEKCYGLVLQTWPQNPLIALLLLLHKKYDHHDDTWIFGPLNQNILKPKRSSTRLHEVQFSSVPKEPCPVCSRKLS